MSNIIPKTFEDWFAERQIGDDKGFMNLKTFI